MLRKQTSSKRQGSNLLVAICTYLIFAMLLCMIGGKQVQAESVDSVTEISYGFLDYQMFENYWTDGMYRCGSDFEPGDYYILSLFGATANYDVSDNPNDFEWSNRVIRKVSVSDGQYVRINTGAILVSADEVDTSDWVKYGVYLVGTDIPEGDYKISTITIDYQTKLASIYGAYGAYQISESSLENEPVDFDTLQGNQTYISVKNGQYLIINNAEMTLVGSKKSSTIDGENSDTESTSTAETASTEAVVESAGTTESTSNKASANTVKTAYDEACSLTISDLYTKTSFTGTTFYYYQGLIIQTEDTEWLLTSWNTTHSLDYGALYRTIAHYLVGYKEGLNTGKSYCLTLCGKKWEDVDDFNAYATNAAEFICEDDSFTQVFKKLESLKCVDGSFDFENGKFDVEIADLSECADEMMISQKMLGYILAMLEEKAPEITFEGNSCQIQYARYNGN